MSVKLVLCLLSAILLVKAEENPTDDWFYSKNPITVAIRSNLYTVSNYKEYLHVRMSNQSVTQKWFEIKLNSVNESITGKMKAVSLYHKIVVWGKRNEELTDNGDIRRTNYTFFLIDPERRTHYVFADLTDEVPSSYPDRLPEVMAHQDSFDIFFPSQKKCSPCSYDVNGERLTDREQLEHEGSPGSAFYLREIGVTNNYIYLYNLDNGTARVRSINGDFKYRFNRNLTIDASVNHLAVYHAGGNSSYVGISYMLHESPRRPRFLLFNEDLQPIHLAHLPLLDYYELVDTSIAIDSRGYFYVTMIQRSVETRKITRTVYNPNGQIMSNLDISELKPKVDYDVQTFVNEREYCLVTHRLSSTFVTKIKCWLL